MEWFDLYLYLRVRHNIQNKDTYNMEENGNALGATFTVKLISNMENKAIFWITTSNQE